MPKNGILRKRIHEIFNIQTNFLKSILTSENENVDANIHSNVHNHEAINTATIEAERNKATALIEKQKNLCR